MVISEKVAIRIGRVVVGEFLNKRLYSLFLCAIVIEFFLQGRKSIMQCFTMREKILFLDNVARLQGKVTM